MSTESVVDCSGTTVGYATDVEGNLAFWNKYVEHSAVLSSLDGPLLVLKDGCHFVYGGDSCDRGCGDLQVLFDLVSLKDRYPDRVHLLMGNRDINKLRFPTAMLPEVLSLKPECYFALQSADISNNPEYRLNDRVSKMKWVSTHLLHFERHTYSTLNPIHQIFPDSAQHDGQPARIRVPPPRAAAQQLAIQRRRRNGLVLRSGGPAAGPGGEVSRAGAGGGRAGRCDVPPRGHPRLQPGVSFSVAHQHLQYAIFGSPASVTASSCF